MVEKSQVPSMRCTKHVFLFIASFLPCYDHVCALSVTSKSIRSDLEYSGLTKNRSTIRYAIVDAKVSQKIISHLTYSLKVVHNIFIRVRLRTRQLEELLQIIMEHGSHLKDRGISLEYLNCNYGTRM